MSEAVEEIVETGVEQIAWTGVNPEEGTGLLGKVSIELPKMANASPTPSVNTTSTKGGILGVELTFKEPVLKVKL